MNKLSIKSILLGMGIGIFLSSLFGILYFYSTENFSAEKQPIKYDEETIVREAEKLGMVKMSKIIVNEKSEKETPKPTLTPTPVPTPTPTPTLGPEVVIVVSQGDTAVNVARKMAEKGLITDQEEFVNKMIETRAAYTMFAREYRFNIGMDYTTIINKLVTR